MSEVSKLIFHGREHWLSSAFGYRSTIETPGGKTASFHSGADYATNRKKLAQCAIENEFTSTSGSKAFPAAAGSTRKNGAAKASVRRRKKLFIPEITGFQRPVF